LNKYLRAGQIEKLKNFKLWVDQKLPKQLKPVLNYTLGWLSPELLGTGFSILKQTDGSMSAQIPFLQINKDFQNQIHQGLVINAGFEMIRTFLNEYFLGHGYQFLKTESTIQKKTIWASDLNLEMNVDLEDFEQQFISFQKNKSAEFTFIIVLKTEDLKKTDSIQYKIEMQKINLLS
jgi:hypothetical protein